MASTKEDQSNDDGKGTRKELPESIQKLRDQRRGSAAVTSTTSESTKYSIQESLNRMGGLKGPYSKQPPVYVGKLNRKDLARKNRIQTAFIGLGLGTFVLGVYGYTIWKRMQLGIDDTELIRLEEEALKMVESGEIDLDALEREAEAQKHHEY